MKNINPVFDARIDPSELEKILQSIDENIAVRSGARQTTAANNAEPIPQPAPVPASAPIPALVPGPSPVPDFSAAITMIRNAQAPYYVVDGSLPGRVIKKVFNLFIKIFGRKQAYYNNLTLDVLSALAAHMNTLQQQNSSQVNAINDLINTVAQLEISVEELYTAQGNSWELIEPLPKALESKSGQKRKKSAQR